MTKTKSGEGMSEKAREVDWAIGDRALLAKSTKDAIRQAILDVESETSAELVVLVRWESATYRDTDFAVGFGLSVVTLMALLYMPHAFPLWVFAVDVPITFALGALVTATLPALRRLATARAHMELSVQRAARAAFYDYGLTKTSRRSGILVYVSAFEGLVEVLHDIGLDPETLGSGWKRTLEAIRSAAQASDPKALVDGLERLGPVLGEHYPRRGDDVDELPDEPVFDEKSA
jgi:putative membrane protein